jgi:hypothetical protein
LKQTQQTSVGGWIDCGADGEGKQVLINIAVIKQIEIEPLPSGGDAVTIHYAGPGEPAKLGPAHRKQFLVSVGLRQLESKLYVPDPKSSFQR